MEARLLYYDTTKMTIPTLMTIPLEVRLRIYELSLPQEVVADCCTCHNKIDGRPIHIPHRPRLPLLMISKQAYREMQRVHVPIVVAQYCDMNCMSRWFHGPRKRRTKKLSMIKAVRVSHPADLARLRRMYLGYTLPLPRREAAATWARMQGIVGVELLVQSLTVLQHYFRFTNLSSVHWQTTFPHFDELHMEFRVGGVIV